jgi:hypothetical protein
MYPIVGKEAGIHSFREDDGRQARNLLDNYCLYMQLFLEKQVRSCKKEGREMQGFSL